MDTRVKQSLYAAILKLLRPLIRILLRNGIPYGALADLARWVYVDLAFEEFAIPGRKQSVSRVSILTGLSRKEVNRLRQLAVPHDDESLERYNRAARVIGGWIRDPRFTDRQGGARPLFFDRGETTFGDLVKVYSGDVPARAVLDELEQAGAVEISQAGEIRLLSRAYIPRVGEIEKLGILGTDVADLIATIDHNVSRSDLEPHFQRKVSYDNVPAEAVPAFRSMSAAEAQELLERFDRWLAQHDRDRTPAVEGTGRRRVGIGIYYFEEDLEPAESDSDHNGGRS